MIKDNHFKIKKNQWLVSYLEKDKLSRLKKIYKMIKFRENSK